MQHDETNVLVLRRNATLVPKCNAYRASSAMQHGSRSTGGRRPTTVGSGRSDRPTSLRRRSRLTGRRRDCGACQQQPYSCRREYVMRPAVMPKGDEPMRQSTLHRSCVGCSGASEECVTVIDYAETVSTITHRAEIRWCQQQARCIKCQQSASYRDSVL